MDTKALRQKILDLAIRGKLVPQDPNDEPASVLLERIREEKKQMVKEGKLKAKDIKNDTIIFKGEDNLHYEKFQDGTIKCIEDEIPFEVPDGWEWCRIRDVAAVKGGKRVPKGCSLTDDVTEHAYIRVTDMKNNTIILDDIKYIDDDIYEKIKAYTISADDLYITVAGTIGAVGTVPSEMDGMNLTENAVKATNIQINKNFLCYVIQSELVQNQFQDKTHHVAMPKLAIERILSTFIPVPPYEEQIRINKIIKDIINKIEIVDEEKTILKDAVDIAKAKVLDLAIRGKLVPQDPNDEPASALLARIRTEKEALITQGKLKRDKKESIIYKGDDNSYYQTGSSEPIDVPYEIPETWVWSNLKELCNYGVCDNISPETINSDAWILDLEDIEKNTGKVLYRATNAERKTTSTKHSFRKGMILYSKLRPYLNKVVLANEDGYCTSEIIPLQFSEIILPRYAQLFLMSPFFVGYANHCSYGMKMPRLGTHDGEKALFAIPPYQEQARIVDMVDKLHANIDIILESLTM